MFLCRLTLTLHACGVQRETFRAFTVEATRRVDARGPGTTHTVLSGTLIVVCKERKHIIEMLFKKNAYFLFFLDTHVLYSPIQAVWCCVKPGGHLQVKPPMVLTQRNWQLCCLVEHSSRSKREIRKHLTLIKTKLQRAMMPQSH